MDTALTRLVGCSVPIQQAPMGGISGPELAAAVAEAGGVGTVTALLMPPERLDALLSDLTSRTGGALAVNVLTLDPEAVQVAAGRVRLVDCFWFDPAPALVALAHGGGSLVSWQVGSVDEARAAVDAGADVVIAQGTEAGGHVRGRESLRRLLGDVLATVDVPVVAAGGIADARGFAAVMEQGAAGARVGTRFLASTESRAHPAYKQAVVDAGADSTEITDAFADCPLCATSPRARVLRRAIDAVHAATDDVVGEAPLGSEIVPVTRGSGLPPLDGATGDLAAMALYAGESVAAIHDVVPAAEIITRLTTPVPDPR